MVDTPRKPTRRASGFSLLEVLIAAALFGALVLGIVPLFVRAASLLHAGRGSTEAAHFTHSRAEEILGLPWDGPALFAESAGESVFVDYRATGANRWSSRRPETPVAWIRTTTLRRFAVEALDDGYLALAEILPHAARPGRRHLWEIQIEVRSAHPQTLFGAGRRTSVRLLKAL